MTEVIYTPGVCNIGKEEIARRKQIGWIGLIITVVLAVLLLALHVPALWRLTVFLPAFVAASGFVQAYFHFCVGFAQAGVYNLGTVGTTQAITDQSSKQSDAKRTVQLYVYILLIALLITAIAFLF